MENEFTYLQNLNGDNMQEIKNIVDQINMIMRDGNISQNSVVNALEGKCARATVLNIFKGEGDFKLSSLLMVLEVIGVDLRLETEKSREAIMAGDIAAYRVDNEKLRSDLEKERSANAVLNARVNDLQASNVRLTGTVESQQQTINRYIERMDRAEQRLDSKDERIVELSRRLGIW